MSAEPEVSEVEATEEDESPHARDVARTRECEREEILILEVCLPFLATSSSQVGNLCVVVKSFNRQCKLRPLLRKPNELLTKIGGSIH